MPNATGNRDIKIIKLSKRGKELTNIGAFKYRFIGFIQKGEILKWRCSKINRTAMIIQRYVPFRYYLLLNKNDNVVCISVPNRVVKYINCV